MQPTHEMRAPRVLQVDLDRLGPQGVRTTSWEDEGALCAELGSWGGSALGLALLLEQAESNPEALGPFVVTVGECVTRAVPTAARATLMARSPLSGLLSEGQVGGVFAVAFARVTDALALRGRTSLDAAVLWIDAHGVASLRSAPGLRGLDARAAGRWLRQECGPCAGLVIGPAGEDGIPFANLGTAEDHPSFVGRGGLGAVLGKTGVKAIAVELADEPRHTAPFPELVQRLAASPRLTARAGAGTLELFHAFAARGDLPAKGGRAQGEAGQRLAGQAEERGLGRKGCRGCPTPCGWVFERAHGERQGAHFSASFALGAQLGLERFEDSLELLAACDRYGLDAKEVGAVLLLAAEGHQNGALASGPVFGERDSFLETVRAIAEGDPSANSLRRGSVSLARELGRLEDHPHVRGQAARPESSLAAVLGQCVSSAGPDPMRSFPFLLDASSAEGLQRILGTGFPQGTTDARRPEGKGALVFWHENLVSAVDMTGFCSFSTAGLLADELCTLDELGAWILPAALREPEDEAWSELSPGRRLYAAGASLVLLRRRINELWGAPRDPDRPPWARAVVDQPGMLPDYLRLRRLDTDGRVPPATLALLGTPALVPEPEVVRVTTTPPPVRVTPRGTGTVHLRSVGSLARELGADASVELALPATLGDVLRAAAGGREELAGRLHRDGRSLPSVWRAGERLGDDDVVADGDVLDLVLVISGG